MIRELAALISNSPEYAVELFGGLIGIAIFIVIAIAYITVADAAAEWITESVWDRRRGKDVQILPDSNHEVLISDIHIDTWDYSGPQHSGRHSAFLAFLGTVKLSSRIKGFVFNGDLMDMPLFSGAVSPKPDPIELRISKTVPSCGVLDPRYDTIVHSLITLKSSSSGNAGKERVVFQSGNHDIGIQGMRFSRPGLQPWMPDIDADWNPEIKLEAAPGAALPYCRPIYIEHGHNYDPLLWLYLRYSMIDLTRGGDGEQEPLYVSAMQRNGRVGLGRPSHMGRPGSKGPAHAAAVHAVVSQNQADLDKLVRS